MIEGPVGAVRNKSIIIYLSTRLQVEVFKIITVIMIMPLDEIPPPHHGPRAHAKCFPGR